MTTATTPLLSGTYIADPVHSSFGFAVRYQINDCLEVSLDVSNILDTTAVMQQQVFGDAPGSPGAKPVKIDSGWTRNDRRYQLGVRFRY